MPKKQPVQREGASVLTMVLWLMVFVVWLSWAIAASAYFDVLPVQPGSRSGGIVLLLSFLVNSLRLDALPDVFMNSLRHHQWHFVLFAALEAMIAGFGIWVKRLESALDRTPRKPRSR